jgi:hypothetical protein
MRLTLASSLVASLCVLFRLQHGQRTMFRWKSIKVRDHKLLIYICELLAVTRARLTLKFLIYKVSSNYRCVISERAPAKVAVEDYLSRPHAGLA